MRRLSKEKVHKSLFIHCSYSSMMFDKEILKLRCECCWWYKSYKCSFKCLELLLKFQGEYPVFSINKFVHKDLSQGWQSSIRNSTSAEQTAEIFRCRLVSFFDFQGRKCISSVPELSDETSMLTLNKYELNRLKSYCSGWFKKYEQLRPISSVFVLSMCVTGYIWSALWMTRFLWQNVIGYI